MPSTYLYGVLLTIAFALGLLLFWRNRPVKNFSFDNFIDMSLIMAFLAIIGARLLYIALYPEQFSTFYDYIALHEGGLVFYGGFVAAISGLIIYCHRKKIDLAPTLAGLAPSLALGHSIGRLGCFNNNCCYGKTTNCCQIYHLPGDPAGVYRHPTQLYEAFFLLILMPLLQLQLNRCRSDQNADYLTVVSGYIFGYTIFRFLIEFLRGDDRGGFFWYMSISQILSLLIMTVMLVITIKRKHNSGKNN
jgi:phosphatidylglycerol:prolipoprotein diacylglycerol transferase